jgi:hypothetical protein
MRSQDKFTPPPWIESDSVRETLLHLFEMVASYCASCGSDLGSKLEPW